MNAASARRKDGTERLLLVDPCAGEIGDAHVSDLPAILRDGDLIIVNDAATLPASFRARTIGGELLELRLLSRLDGETWRAVLFGEGDWRQRTEDRPAPPRVEPGDTLILDGGLTAAIQDVSPVSPRLVDVVLSAEKEELWEALYRAGRPVQYSYLGGDVDLGDVQTAYAARPWAVEMPSAGRPLRWSTLLALRRNGVRLATLTHAAGLSATGDPALDAALPLAERFDIPETAVAEITAAADRGGRVIAVGTTVVRALESAARLNGGELGPGRGVTEIRLSAHFEPAIVDGILTGMHEPGSSHHELLEAFAPAELLATAHAHAEAAGYLAHEFGDASLVLCG